MNQQACEIGPVIQEIWGIRRPDSDYEGNYHHLGFDWSIFETDLEAFIGRLRGLCEAIGPVAVKDIVGQLMWRVPDGREAERSFLKAAFGEVFHVG